MKNMNVNRTSFPGAGLLVLRLVAGVRFLLHGLDTLVDLADAERPWRSSRRFPFPPMEKSLAGSTSSLSTLPLRNDCGSLD
jgi:uncharacterized membrane protein YphA (DoxX/SURF4 family)